MRMSLNLFSSFDTVRFCFKSWFFVCNLFTIALSLGHLFLSFLKTTQTKFDYLVPITELNHITFVPGSRTYKVPLKNINVRNTNNHSCIHNYVYVLFLFIENIHKRKLFLNFCNLGSHFRQTIDLKQTQRNIISERKIINVNVNTYTTCSPYYDPCVFV